MEDSFKAIGLGVVAAAVVGGLAFLTDRYFEAYWPTMVLLLIPSLIAFFITGLALGEPLKLPGKVGFVLSFLIWGVIFFVPGYWLWERGTLSPLWFGIASAVALSASFFIMDRDYAATEKELGIENRCPNCGKKLGRPEQKYMGSSETVGAGGRGYSTAHWDTVFVCKKCGWEGTR